MLELTVEQVRRHRLWAHHLDRAYPAADAVLLAGACGLQNSPPGAWESALYNRAPGCTQAEMERLLCEERTLLQAWSLRGAPYVFPTAESAVFLSALAASDGEEWIYTHGIGLALEYLQMDFAPLLDCLLQVLPRLDKAPIVSKVRLDATVAAWMRPLLPAEKQPLWDAPSMYGSPDKQTVGGAVVSFLLRPAALAGLVVFGAREGVSPTFTSYQSWVGEPLPYDPEAGQKLVRKFLHCYGPATAEQFCAWTGCGKAQGRRLWKLLEEEMEPVRLLGKRGWVLSADRTALAEGLPLEREVLLLAGHDPYLDQRDRLVLQADKALHRKIWRTVGNPGAIVRQGEIVGVWTAKKQPAGFMIAAERWGDCSEKALADLVEQYAAFRGQRLLKLEL